MYMSYCRFEGTKQELSACLRDVEGCVNEEPGYGDVSDREVTNFKNMVVDFVDWLHDMCLLDDEGNIDHEELDRTCEAMMKTYGEEEE